MEENVVEKKLRQIEKKLPPEKRFPQMTSMDIIDVLGTTIKKDDASKLVTFLCCLLAYTDDLQFNVSFNAPSSAGKSYIPIEVASYFPENDVVEYSVCSPTAFYHEDGKYNKERKGIEIDLSRKIIIFLDQPTSALLQRLRSLLSHDKKEITAKITDRNQKYGYRAKTVFIKGFPSVIFSSAGLRMDEQEMTRFLLLSPQLDQDKIKASIHEKIVKQSNVKAYREALAQNPLVTALRERLLAIKEALITDVIITNPDIVERRFLEGRKTLQPRHSRDVSRVMSFICGFALFNLWHRKRSGNTIYANDYDVDEAFNLWAEISESQDYGVSPYLLDIYRNVILPAYEAANKDIPEEVFEGIVEKAGVTRQEILSMYRQVNGKHIDTYKLRMEILPMLENAGLIYQEQDKNDKRKLLVYPIVQDKINSEEKVGVNTQK